MFDMVYFYKVSYIKILRILIKYDNIILMFVFWCFGRLWVEYLRMGNLELS